MKSLAADEPLGSGQACAHTRTPARARLDSRNADEVARLKAIVEELRLAEGRDGEPVDQYGRNQSECLRSAVLAQGHADDAFAAVAEMRDGSIILGRLGGHHQLRRLEAIALLFERTAERDLAFVDAFELAGGEDDEDDVPDGDDLSFSEERGL